MSEERNEMTAVAKLTKSMVNRVMELKYKKTSAQDTMNLMVKAAYEACERRMAELDVEERALWAEISSEYGLDSSLSYAINAETQTVVRIHNREGEAPPPPPGPAVPDEKALGTTESDFLE